MSRLRKNEVYSFNKTACYEFTRHHTLISHSDGQRVRRHKNVRDGGGGEVPFLYAKVGLAFVW